MPDITNLVVKGKVLSASPDLLVILQDDGTTYPIRNPFVEKYDFLDTSVIEGAKVTYTRLGNYRELDVTNPDFLIMEGHS